MYGSGRFLANYGWKAFLLMLFLILFIDYILGKFINSDRQKNIVLYVIVTLLAGLEFHFKFFESLK